MVGLFFYEPLVLCGTGFHQTTFHTAHLYYNWNGTIEMPPVLKYVGTLAKHAGDRYPVRGTRTRRWVIALTSNTSRWWGSKLHWVWQTTLLPAPFTASGKLTR